MIAKQLSIQEGRWALAGVCEEIKDVMDMTGFSSHFKTFDTVAEAMKAVREGE
jgi:anti-anti-sigma regulatory factor